MGSVTAVGFRLVEAGDRHETEENQGYDDHGG